MAGLRGQTVASGLKKILNAYAAAAVVNIDQWIVSE